MLPEFDLAELIRKEGCVRVDAVHLTQTFNVPNPEQVYMVAQIFALENNFQFFRKGTNFVFLTNDYEDLTSIAKWGKS